MKLLIYYAFRQQHGEDNHSGNKYVFFYLTIVVQLSNCPLPYNWFYFSCTLVKIIISLYSLCGRFRYIIAYWQLVRWCWGFLGKHVLVALPSCAVNNIRSTLPADFVAAGDCIVGTAPESRGLCFISPISTMKLSS